MVKLGVEKSEEKPVDEYHKFHALLKEVAKKYKTIEFNEADFELPIEEMNAQLEKALETVEKEG